MNLGNILITISFTIGICGILFMTSYILYKLVYCNIFKKEVKNDEKRIKSQTKIL